MKNLTGLVKKMSISKCLNAGALSAEMSSNQFGTDENGRSLQLEKVDKVLGTSLVDGLVNFKQMKQHQK